jgi:shikimate dehydrogenase
MAPYRFAVLGDPVEHSRSPRLHNTMLEIAGLTGEYQRVRADDDVLREAVDELRRGDWDGLNITMPLKASAARLADSLSPSAARSGSVNTLIRRDSGIEGDSTDSAAFRSLVQSERFADRAAVLILGAGASAAAALAAMEDDTNVYVSARRATSAEDLTVRLGGEVVSWEAVVAGALVINTTPLGMSGEQLPDGILAVASGLIDLPYGSRTTPTVEEAERSSMPFADGHEFLLRQALFSFELWTGTHLEYDTVAAALRNT